MIVDILTLAYNFPCSSQNGHRFAQKSVINIKLYWTFIVKNVVKCWSHVSLQNCHKLQVLLKQWQRSATSTLFRRVFVWMDTLSFPVPPSPKVSIVLFLWLIKRCTEWSRWWWTMPLSFQCREIFKLCVPLTKLGLF